MHHRDDDTATAAACLRFIPSVSADPGDPVMTPVRSAVTPRTLPSSARTAPLVARMGLGMTLGVAAILAVAPAALAQSSLTRVQTFSYNATTGQLTQQKAEPDTAAITLTTDYTYDAFGNQLTATVSGPDIASRTTSAGYDANGRFQTSATNALAHSESYETDARFGAATKLTGPNALDTTWTYDGFGRKTKEVRADGTETRWTYELCAAQCPSGGVYLASAQDFITSSGAPTTAKTIEYFDKLNRVFRSETEGFDGTPVYVDTEFTARGEVHRVSKPYFQGTPAQDILWTTYAYDTVGRLTSVTLPDGGVESTAYDGLTTTLTNALTQTSVRVENALGELVSATDNLAGVTTYSYDPFGNLTETDAAGVVTTMTYDVRGLKLTMDDPDMGDWSYDYNALGELTSQTDAKLQVTAMAYDVLGRMVSRTDDFGTLDAVTTTWTYDTAAMGIGKIASVSAPHDSYAESMTYDSLGRPSVASVSIDSTTYDTQTLYDTAGRADTLIYPSGFKVKSVFTSRGHLAEVTDDLATTTYWQADTVNAEGQVTAETLGNGVTTTRVYDPATSRIDSITTVKGPTFIQDLAFDFDTLGNLTARRDLRQSREELFTYDGLNRFTSSTLTNMGGSPQPQTLLEAHFDSDAEGFVYADDIFGSNSYSWYYADGDWQNGALTVSLGNINGLDRFDMSGGWTKSFTVLEEMTVSLSFAYSMDFAANYESDEYSQVLLSFDGGTAVEVARLTGDGNGGGNQTTGQQTHVADLGTLQPGTYSISIGGYNNKKTESDEWTDITLDDVVVTGTPTSGGTLQTLNTTTYTYDSLGNITNKSDVGMYTYGNGQPGQPGPHAVVSAGGNTYTYDANGSMIAGAGKTTTWTAFNKPEKIVASVNDETFFVYGPSRARFKQNIKKGGLITNVTYVGSHFEKKTRLGEDDELVHYIRAGATVAIYTEFRDSQNTVTSSKTRYLHRDHLGSVESITDEAGVASEYLSYDPHGKRRLTDWQAGTPATPAETPRGFTGHEHLDAVGLVHMNGRVYDPTLGRFLSADPFVQFPETTQSFNRYTYVNNNPLSYTDPSGFGIWEGYGPEDYNAKTKNYGGETLGEIDAAIGRAWDALEDAWDIDITTPTRPTRKVRKALDELLNGSVGGLTDGVFDQNYIPEVSRSAIEFGLELMGYGQAEFQTAIDRYNARAMGLPVENYSSIEGYNEAYGLGVALADMAAEEYQQATNSSPYDAIQTHQACGRSGCGGSGSGTYSGGGNGRGGGPRAFNKRGLIDGRNPSGGPSGRYSGWRFIGKHWDKGTFKTPHHSFEHHYNMNGAPANLTPLQYIVRAHEVWKRSIKNPSIRQYRAGYWENGVYKQERYRIVDPELGTGLYTLNGRAISFKISRSQALPAPKF